METPLKGWRPDCPGLPFLYIREIWRHDAQTLKINAFLIDNFANRQLRERTLRERTLYDGGSNSTFSISSKKCQTNFASKLSNTQSKMFLNVNKKIFGHGAERRLSRKIKKLGKK